MMATHEDAVDNSLWEISIGSKSWVELVEEEEDERSNVPCLRQSPQKQVKDTLQIPFRTFGSKDSVTEANRRPTDAALKNVTQSYANILKSPQTREFLVEDISLTGHLDGRLQLTSPAREGQRTPAKTSKAELMPSPARLTKRKIFEEPGEANDALLMPSPSKMRRSADVAGKVQRSTVSEEQESSIGSRQVIAEYSGTGSPARHTRSRASASTNIHHDNSNAASPVKGKAALFFSSTKDNSSNTKDEKSPSRIDQAKIKLGVASKDGSCPSSPVVGAHSLRTGTPKASRKRSRETLTPRRKRNSWLENAEKECDPETLARRQKQIDYGKNTIGYERYSQLVPHEKRTPQCPRTPPLMLKYSRRAWDGMIRVWRQRLHFWDPPGMEGSADGSEDGFEGLTSDVSSTDGSMPGTPVQEAKRRPLISTPTAAVAMRRSARLCTSAPNNEDDVGEGCTPLPPE